MITILTRSGYRQKDFEQLRASINKQTIKPYHFISNDNPNCTFLSNEKNVFPVVAQPEKGKAFYNLYLNELVSNVEEGWIIILDDDSKLIDNTFIEKLMNICKNTSNDKIIIYQNYIQENKIKIPHDSIFNNKRIKKGNIDMSNFCIHHSVLKQVKFHGKQCGDYNILKKLKDKNFEFKFINNIPIGIWANYQGEKHGKNI